MTGPRSSRTYSHRLSGGTGTSPPNPKPRCSRGGACVGYTRGVDVHAPALHPRLVPIDLTGKLREAAA